ncbi:MAG: PorV/PorQ family protein [Candidatus Delongbacteria bacterium]|nr:PorV/PorQ family protein [Candidatus Delongbacteria bacterium]
MQKILIIIPLILMLSLIETEARLGGSGANFLAIGGGGRALSLSGAYSAMANDLDALFYNPAGIAHLKQPTIGMTYISYYAEMSYQAAGIAVPLGVVGTMGFSFTTLQSGDIEITTLDEQNGTGRHYSANDYAFGLTYAKNLTDKFCTGGTFKVIRQGIDELSATSWAVDLGATYNTGFRNLRFGFSILNFGPDMQFRGDALKFHGKPIDTESGDTSPNMAEDVLAQWESDKYALPLSFQIGVAYDILNNSGYRWSVSFDKVNPTDQDETYATGTELSYRDLLNLRVGYSERNNRKLTAGAGIVLPLGQSKLIVDYSFQDHDYLDSLHSMSFSFVF